MQVVWGQEKVFLKLKYGLEQTDEQFNLRQSDGQWTNKKQSHKLSNSS